MSEFLTQNEVIGDDKTTIEHRFSQESDTRPLVTAGKKQNSGTKRDLVRLRTD